jgi:UDP-3-O-[3-hydroxymyristoyl] glucosamine N-acyltransferase
MSETMSQSQPIKFKILNASGKKLCFVGHSNLTRSVFPIVGQSHDCENVSVEDLHNQSIDWFQQRSFIIISSDVAFKIKIVDYLDSKNASYFSIINELNNINVNVQIGDGTCIFSFNDMTIGPITIGRHCVIGSHNIFSHGVNIGDFCHVGHHGFYNKAMIGKGNVFGIGVSLVDDIKIVDFCNCLTGSVITKNISVPGTYHGNRKLNSHTSLTNRIL